VGGLTDDGGIHPIRLAAVLFHSNPQNSTISMSSSLVNHRRYVEFTKTRSRPPQLGNASSSQTKE
jgi:hypothetical protein